MKFVALFALFACVALASARRGHVSHTRKPHVTAAPVVVVHSTEAMPVTTEAPSTVVAHEDHHTEGPKSTEGPKTTEGTKVTEGPKSTEGSKVTEGPMTTEGSKVTEGPKNDKTTDKVHHDDDSSTEGSSTTDGDKLEETTVAEAHPATKVEHEHNHLHNHPTDKDGLTDPSVTDSATNEYTEEATNGFTEIVEVSTSSEEKPDGPSGKKMKPGTIAAIVVGGILALMVVVAVAMVVVKRRNQSEERRGILEA